MRGVVAPTRDDPLVAASSPAIGGPVGDHARQHPFWTPLRVVLALVTLAGALNLVHTAPCQTGAWWNGQSYANLCYSDVPITYVQSAPSVDTAPVAALTWLAEAGARLADQPLEQEAGTVYGLYALLMFGAMLGLAALLVRLSGRRPWDGAAFAIAPVLVLAATIGWDLLGALLAVAAVFAWSRRRFVVAGLLLGSAVATAVWPVLVLVVMVVLAGRSRQLRAAGVTAATTAAGWVAWQLPSLLLAPGTWWDTVNHTLGGQIGYGSLWRLAAEYGLTVSSGLLVRLVVVGLVLVLVAVVALAVRSRRPPRLPQLVLLLLIGALVVWPVYSPQYVLWLLPFAVLARPRWRDLLIWQAGEVAYNLSIWWTLSGATVDAGTVDKPYAVAIVVRVLAELWLAGVVLRDVLHPELDPVRADLVTDDPAMPARVTFPGGPAKVTPPQPYIAGDA